jgi:type VI secretion system protein VasG
MATVNLKSLVGHLNDSTRRALEGAAGLCLSQTNYNVEIEHWLMKLIESSGDDLEPILRRFEIDPSRLKADLTAAIDRFKTGNSRPPALSPTVVDLAKEAWLAASLEFDAPQVRSGHVLYALVSSDMLARQAQGISGEFANISAESLRAEFETITGNSDEAQVSVPSGTGGGAGGAPARAKGSGKTPNLDQYTIDLTERARGGHIDPVLGRDPEIRQIIDILTRRRQNNPILTGEAGVGKTAVAEGFALRLISGDVHPALQNVALRTLDLGLLQAGAGVKGEFENRLKGVIDEVKSSPIPIILFIDEAHTLIGAGGSAGQGDAANLLKPALARGELRTIAATTWAEYKKYFERDAALARRFQVVKIEEPDEKIGAEIMRGLSQMMENHHNVRILDEALIASVKLSSRYISGRQLPDKSVSLLDTACARVALSQSATPPAVEDCRRRIAQIEVSLGIAEREDATGGDQAERIAELTEERGETEEQLAALEERWKKEKELVEEMREIRTKLEADHARARQSSLPEKSSEEPAEKPAEKGAKEEEPVTPLTDEEKTELKEKLAERNDRLAEIQGEEPLVNACVDSQAIAEVVGAWTGIPVGRMVSDEMATILNLRETMEAQVVGQGHALEALAQSIRTSRAGLTDPKRPIGVFMLVGTSGVGKTETAKVLTDLFYGGEQNMTVINMSEFKEEHKVSMLLGSPPGYVGYGEGGVLTEAVRRKPYSVVLLDELEKAHPGVQDIFYRLFDEGILTDGEGRNIDFCNTIILMTTNAGTDTIMSLCADPETMPDAEGLTKALRPELLKTFKPAFLGRVTILPYFPLGDDVMKKIIKLKLGKIRRRVAETYDAAFEYDPEVVDAIAARCTEVESGARNVDHILTRTVLPEMAAEFLSHMAEGGVISRVRVSVDGDGGFVYHPASDA